MQGKEQVGTEMVPTLSIVCCEQWMCHSEVVPFKRYVFIFLAVLGLHYCVWAFSSCGEWGLLSVAVCVLLIAMDSLVAEHRL